jgi:hypothetical protein
VLLLVELIVTTVLLAVGVSWSSLLASAGPVVALTLAFLNPTVQELGRRQPKLTLLTKESDDQPLVAPAARPWPIDVDRVLVNEVADARETATARHAALDNFLTLSEPFAIRPGEAAHSRAQEAFEEEVDSFERELRAWLDDYEEAARVRADIFGVNVLVDNATTGAHAETVIVILDLPDSVAVADDQPTMHLPPERPSYQPPRARPAFSEAVSPGPFPRVTDFATMIASRTQIPLQKPAWKVSEDGLRLEASVGDVHPGRCVRVDEPLLLRASGIGRHAIKWTVYSKGNRKAASGTLAMEVPPDSRRPGFGRLHGITSYPDVPLVKADGEIVREVRDSDPPARPDPKSADNDLLENLREARAFLEWRALGLDPADDGPDRSTVSRAEPAVQD